MGKYHNVLYIGLKVAWEWGVTDSETIKELLGECKRVQRTVQGFALPASISPNRQR